MGLDKENAIRLLKDQTCDNCRYKYLVNLKGYICPDPWQKRTCEKYELCNSPTFSEVSIDK